MYNETMNANSSTGNGPLGKLTNRPNPLRTLLFRVGIGTAIMIVIIGLFTAFEDNTDGYYQIKQAFYTGEMSSRNNPGTYCQCGGQISTYKFSDDILLSSAEEDAAFADEPTVRVQFPDGWADVDLEVQYKLSGDLDKQLALHREYTSNERVKVMIKQQVVEAVKNTGSLFNSGDAYADNRSDFIRMAQNQIVEGLYIADVSDETITSADGTTRTEKSYTVRLGEDGKPIINKNSVLSNYGITITRFNIKDMDFDEKLLLLIESRKDAQKAQQDALTEKANGDTRIAQERANQEVEKIKQVTIAEKEKEVAVLTAEKGYETERLAALTALETAKKVRAEGEAQAAANQALVRAGLTPLERATIDKETAIGVAAEMAKLKLPSMMIFGTGDGSPMDPFQAVGLESFMKIQKTLTGNGN